jgi:signal transduction histidine kinase/DNA-binding response OmpR family regulator/HPt (histidine-containing phosphotransfer) domain-containing protein
MISGDQAARLQKSKESADLARLLRVIERERELMAELREREIQRTEEMRRAKELADEANRAKSAFLAVVSHEIRTPMTGIMGIVRLLNDTKLSREQGDYMLAIQKSGDTMMALLDDILDFEKIESGNLDLEEIDFDLPRLVQGVVTLMSGHATDKGIILKADIPERFPRYIKADPTRLRQVLLNLANNAIKFTDKGGVTIRLRAARVEDSAVAISKDYEIYCAVEDTGVGISKKAQKTLFNPFEQTDKSITRKYGGTGLGLAICKRIIEAMGAQLRVSSEPGEGSAFFFTILVREGKAEAAEDNRLARGSLSLSSPAKPERKLNVLVVEDNEINRKVLENFIKKDGHTVMLAESAEAGLDIAFKNSFDVIFTDINLPGMSGLMFVQALRQMPGRRHEHTPVIAITGNVGARDLQAIRDAGIRDHIPKPIDHAKLIRIITDIAMLASEKDSSDSRSGGSHALPVLSSAPLASPDVRTVADHASLPTSRKPSVAGRSDEIRPPIQDFLHKMDIGREPGGVYRRTKHDVIDQKTISSLLDTLGKAQFAELMAGFLRKMDEILVGVSQAASARDGDVLRARAHELKGMAANFGLMELSHVSDIIENCTKNGHIEPALAEVLKLPQAAERARDAVEKILR